MLISHREWGERSLDHEFESCQEFGAPRASLKHVYVVRNPMNGAVDSGPLQSAVSQASFEKAAMV